MAPKSRYEWLKNEQAKEHRAEKRSLEEMRRTLALLGTNSVPLGAMGSRGGQGGSQYLGNTGFGEDGQLQPHNPTHLVNAPDGPVMLHEGEDLKMHGNGNIEVIPAGDSLSQSQLSMIEKRGGVRGMQTGGYFSTKPSARTNPFSGQMQAPDMTQVPEMPTFSADKMLPQSYNTGFTPPEATPPEATTMAAPTFDPQATTTQAPQPTELPPPLPPTTMDAPTFDPQASYSPAAAPRPQPVDPNMGRWDRSLGRLEQIASGQDPYAAQIRAQEMQRLSAEEQAQRGALEQQMSQAGVTGMGAATERAMLGSQVGAHQQQLAGQLRQQESQRAMQATTQMPREAAERAMFAEQKKAGLESDASGYFSNMSYAEGYDWRTDDVGRAKLQEMWEASGNTGRFDETWAENFIGASTINVSDAFLRDARNSEWYTALPDESVLDENGNVVTWGKDKVEGGLLDLAQKIALGGLSMRMDPTTGMVTLVDATGTPIDLNVPTITPTWVSGNGENNTAYLEWWKEQDSNAWASGVTVAGMEQWMSQHGNQPPKNEDEWQAWSFADRTFDVSDTDDLQAAYDVMEDNNRIAADMPTLEEVKLWLIQNDGKIGGNADEIIRWREGIATPETIRDFLAGDLTSSLQPREREMLTKSMLAKQLLASRDDYETEEEWQKALEDAKFKNEAEAQWYSDVVSGDLNRDYATPSPEPAPTEFFNRNSGGFTNGTTWTRINTQPEQEHVDWATRNAGKPVEINGTTYILAPQSDLFWQGYQKGGGAVGDPARWALDGKTFISGFKAYNTTTGKWVVISPNTISTVLTADPSGVVDKETNAVELEYGTWQTDLEIYDPHSDGNWMWQP